MEEHYRAARIALLAMTTFLCMAFSFYVASAADPPPLQDFCVAATNPDFSGVYINGKFCKDPKNITVDDFLYKGFNKRGNTTNILNAKATLIDINHFPALNTLGVAIARVDFGPFGLNTPHWHQRGSEVFTVVKGRLYAGFVTSDYKLFQTVLQEGDVIVFPQALVHFQMNLDKTDAYAIAAFGSQNPGRVDLPESVFGSTPYIFDELLFKAFQVEGSLSNRFHINGDRDEDSTWSDERNVMKLWQTYNEAQIRDVGGEEGI